MQVTIVRREPCLDARHFLEWVMQGCVGRFLRGRRRAYMRRGVERDTSDVRRALHPTSPIQSEVMPAACDS